MAILDHAFPKTVESTLVFLNSYQHKINDFNLSVHFLDLWPEWPHPFLTMPNQKKIWSAFNSCINMQKISLYIPSVHSHIQSILESHYLTGHTNFWPCSPTKFSMFTPNIFNHLLICVKLYLHAKISSISSFLRYSQI